MRQSDTVLLEEDVLVVEAPVDRHPPRVLKPMAAPPRLTPPAWWGQDKEEHGLPPPAWQPVECPLAPRQRTSFQQPQLKGREKSMVQVWSGLGKPPPWEELGERGRPWRK